jgi:hypothetical protein
VQTYPAMDAKVAVSVGGGDSPVWSADGIDDRAVEGHLICSSRSLLTRRLRIGK